MKHLLPALLLAALAITNRASAAPVGGQGTSDSVTGTEVTGRLSSGPRPTATPAASKAGAPKVVTAYLNTEENGKKAMTVFAKSDAKIWLICNDGGGAKGDKIRVVWTAEDTGKVFPKNKKLGEFPQMMTGPNQNCTFSAPVVAGGSPVGKYRADVFANDKLAASVKYTVK